jgi:diphthine synthase
MLKLVGLGLYDEKDMSIKAYDNIIEGDYIFIEFYTSRLMGTSIEKLEKLTGKKIRMLNRKDVENERILLDLAKTNKVLLLSAGDPLIATTHIALRLQASEENIPVEIIHGTSIQCAVPGLLGLQSYKFGRTVTMPYPENEIYSKSVYDFIKNNLDSGLHTLVLLDIKQDRFMTANEALKILLKMEEIFKEKVIEKNTIVAVVSQAGSANPTLTSGNIEKLLDKDFGPALHTMVIVGKMHFMEEEALKKLTRSFF